MRQLEQLCLIASVTLAMAIMTGSAEFVQNAGAESWSRVEMNTSIVCYWLRDMTNISGNPLRY
jgi:hypothetical protein